MKKKLRAVLGHEISHLKHKDVAVITMISVIPMICWYFAWNQLFSGGRERGKWGAYRDSGFDSIFDNEIFLSYMYQE